ncbi:MAG TPA: Stp1/IreP family PP2C-type Ser/Thr phosphatase [Herpetosiphonaceae bacterium]
MTLAPPQNPRCPRCQQAVESSARFCRHCGFSLRPPEPAQRPPDSPELVQPALRRMRVETDRISVRALQDMVANSMNWWQMRLKSGEASREEAASSIEELSKALSSLSQQLAQGRDTVRITTTLPPARRFPVGCPRCGKGNRHNARFCINCGWSFNHPLSKPTLILPPLDYTTGLVSDVGAKRKINQDSGAVERLRLKNGLTALCCVVADGMGGHKGGEIASALAVETILRHLREYAAGVDAQHPAWPSAVGAAIAAANAAVFREASAKPELRGMGTTVVLTLIIGTRAIIGSVGDSRVYILNANGVADPNCKINQLTIDHSMVARLVDIGQITEAEARTHPRRNVLYRSIGVEAAVDIDVEEQPLQIGDWLLLCSDGLVNELADDELAEMILAGTLPQQTCQELIAAANRRGARDNVTALLVAVAE